MRFSVKFVSLTLGVLLMLGIVGAGAAFAQTPAPSSGMANATDWQNVFLGKVATILGVDQQKLTDAMQQAAKETRNQQLDEAVAAGRISQDFGNWLKQRPDDGRLDLGLGIGRGGFGGKHGGHLGERGGGMPFRSTQSAPTQAP